MKRFAFIFMLLTLRGARPAVEPKTKGATR